MCVPVCRCISIYIYLFAVKYIVIILMTVRKCFVPRKNWKIMMRFKKIQLDFFKLQISIFLKLNIVNTQSHLYEMFYLSSLFTLLNKRSY